MAFTDDIQIPLYKEGMKCGRLLRWLVADGSRVAQGDSLYEVETDGDTYEVPSFQAGILRIVEDEGNSYPVGHVVGVVEYTESERIDHFYAVVGLNHEQRQVLELLRGDVDARRWIQDEFRQFITEKLESSEQSVAPNRSLPSTLKSSSSVRGAED